MTLSATRLLVVSAAFLALAVPAALAVPPTGHGNGNGNGNGQGNGGSQGTTTTSTAPSASQLCKDQRRTVGMATFVQLYAPGGKPKAAMDACLQKQVTISSTQAKNAAMACKAERQQLGVTAFNDKYGTNPNKRNAFGKCVSAKAKQQANTQQQATLNAAKKCKAERQQLGVTAFNAKYGTNANKKNAFGKCVSKIASSKSSSSS